MNTTSKVAVLRRGFRPKIIGKSAGYVYVGSNPTRLIPSICKKEALSLFSYCLLDIDLPKDNNRYLEVDRQKCRYRFDL
ncbi:hypothetical protein [Pleurocapsa sp. FMAR1]|uniref:hypothetical protein n=1 Tax=Pleurocapsa sp. FMAR1 TaxID=3040204 RepID=UPI0029C7138C|nr:hypothetical protein [Pleurocapsa sp. FMAR1]